MARPKRKKLKFTEASANELLQEIYDDNHNIAAKIKRMFTKWNNNVKEAGEIAAIGESIIKLIQVESKNQDQKLMILKYLMDMVKEDKKNDPNENKSENSFNRDDILRMMEKEYHKEFKK